MRLVLVALVALSSSAFRSPSVAVESVDAIELNHFYDKAGKLVYDQIVFYNFSPIDGCFHVRAWCLAEDLQQQNRRPIKNEVSGVYQVDWNDVDARILRRITSRQFRESWTQTDPEREDKKKLHETSRFSLSKRIGGTNEDVQRD